MDLEAHEFPLLEDTWHTSFLYLFTPLSILADAAPPSPFPRRYRVIVYCPWTQRIETSEASDPYSVALAADGERTQLVDLDAGLASFSGSSPQDGEEAGVAAAANAVGPLEPEGWQGHTSPPLAQWTDISIYELHIRDFRWEGRRRQTEG